MSIISFSFLGFVAVTLLACRAVPQKVRWWVLLLADGVFYASFSPRGLFVMAGTSLVTWFAAVKIQELKDRFSAWSEQNRGTADKDEKKAKKLFYQKKQRAFLSFSVVISLGLLFIFKYYCGFASGINRLFGLGIWTAEKLFIPLGISYYSLMLMGYVTDVYRDIIPAEKNPLKVLLFGSFFLSIMQGPFNRYGDIMPQILNADPPKLTGESFRYHALRIAGGYIKKLCIADQAALIANEVFNNSGAGRYSGFTVIFGVVCFAVQLYADFSGYMDIVAGIGGLFGITLPENFRQPFFSKNNSEFWQRWHITLGLWLKDYVFYPILKSKAWKGLGKSITNKLGKKAGRSIPAYLGMLILWTLIGAWHGAGFNYVFGVGILQFIYIFIGEITAPLSAKAKALLRINDKKLYWRVWQSARTTLLMGFAWIFFRAESFAAAVAIIKRIFVPAPLSQFRLIFSGEGGALPGNEIIWVIYIALCALVLFLQDLCHEKGVRIRDLIAKKPFMIRALAYCAIALTLMIFGSYGTQYISSNFIYFKF